LERMLAFIRPSFNEEMRHGLTICERRAVDVRLRN